MRPSTLHAIQISFFSDPQRRSPPELLDAWPTLVDVAEAACRSGLRVSVIQNSSHSQRFERSGAGYYFLPFGSDERADAHGESLARLLRQLAPDVIHVHGLGFPREVLALARRIPGVPIILQDHADRPPPLWRRRAWRRGMASAAGIAFCAAGQARPFIDAGLIRTDCRIYEIPESTCRFEPGDPAQARQQCGLSGAPAILWVGHLVANKDPLTVLDGIRAAARSLPQLQFFCCFGDAPLLQDVQGRIATSPDLRLRVHLIGRVPHGRIEQLMRAADLFVLGSHREGSGYSLIEALACGLPPVVTDIPSFRSLTAGGAVGKLWSCGNCLLRRSLDRRYAPACARTSTASYRSIRSAAS